MLYKAALDALLGPDVSLPIYSEDPKNDPEPVKAHYLGDATRKKAIDEFKKERPEEDAERANGRIPASPNILSKSGGSRCWGARRNTCSPSVGASTATVTPRTNSSPAICGS